MTCGFCVLWTLKQIKLTIQRSIVVVNDKESSVIKLRKIENFHDQGKQRSSFHLWRHARRRQPHPSRPTDAIF